MGRTDFDKIIDKIKTLEKRVELFEAIDMAKNAIVSSQNSIKLSNRWLLAVP